LAPKERKDRPDPNVAELARAKRRAERAETKFGSGPQGDRDPGKSIRALGAAAGREQHGSQAEDVIDEASAELETLAGTSGACPAVVRPRASHYRHLRPARLGPPRPRPTLANALTETEREEILSLLHGRFVDCAPAQAWATLLDEGTYLGSEPTMVTVGTGTSSLAADRTICKLFKADIGSDEPALAKGLLAAGTTVTFTLRSSPKPSREKT